MAQKSVVTLGILLLTIIAGAIIITLPTSDVQIKIDKAESTFFVKENGKFVVGGVEKILILDGNRVFSPIPKKTIITNYTINDNLVVERQLFYKNNVYINEKYIFTSTNPDVTLFPLNHSITVFNGSGKTLSYQVSQLQVINRSVALNQNSFKFGRKMNIEIDSFYSNVSIIQNTFRADYFINSAAFSMNARLFDPPVNTTTLIGRYNMNETIGGNIVDSSGFSPQLNASLTNAVFDSIRQQTNISGSNGHVRINFTTDKYKLNGSNITVGIWLYIPNDTGTNFGIYKWGATNPPAYGYCQMATSNNWRIDAKNASGTDFFYTSNLACPVSNWTLYVFTTDTTGLMSTYTCQENSTVNTGNTFTPTGGNWNVPSTAYLIGGDGGTGGMTGAVGGIIIYNRTMSSSQIQELCNAGKNFNTELTDFVSANFSSSISTISGYRGTNTHPWPLAAGCRVGNTTSAGEIQNCSYDWHRQRFLEARLDIARQDLALGDTTTSPGSNNFTQQYFTTFPQSNYASAILANNSSAWLGSQNKIIFWDGDTTPSWNNNSTFCTGFKTCPALNYTQKENTVYAWLNYTRADLYTVWVGGKNEPFAVNPPFFLNSLSDTERCNATNYPIVRDLIVRENNATFNAVNRFNSDKGANVKKIFSGTYTFENGSTQEKCDLNMSIDVVNILSVSHPDTIFQIHDYYNNNENDSSNSFVWFGQRNTLWNLVKPLININESQIILGETNNYDNESMCLNSNKLYADNLNILLASIHPNYVSNNWSIIHYEYAATGPRAVECAGGNRYYAMVSDPVLDNETTKIFDAYKHVGVTHPRGNIVVNTTDGNETLIVCSKGSVSRTCSISNLGTSTRNITLNVTFGSETLINATNIFTNESYPFTVNNSVYSIQIGNLGQYEADHINLTTASSYSTSINYCSGISNVVFLADVRNFNFTTRTITQFNTTAWNQSTCLFNITSTQPTYTVKAFTNTTTTSQQRVYCGSSLSNKVEINTTSTSIFNNSFNSTVSCWMDFINTSSSIYKNINVSIEVV